MVVYQFTRTVLPYLESQFGSVRRELSVMEYSSDAYLLLHSLDQAASRAALNRGPSGVGLFAFAGSESWSWWMIPPDCNLRQGVSL